MKVSSKLDTIPGNASGKVMRQNRVKNDGIHSPQQQVTVRMHVVFVSDRDNAFASFGIDEQVLLDVEGLAAQCRAVFVVGGHLGIHTRTSESSFSTSNGLAM